jgi:hypothetical protein
MRALSTDEMKQETRQVNAALNVNPGDEVIFNHLYHTLGNSDQQIVRVLQNALCPKLLGR